MSEIANASRHILDSFALLAYLQREPGWDFVRELLRRAERGETSLHFSLINWGELSYTLARRRGWEVALETARALELLPIRLEGVDQQRVLAAAGIKAAHPLAYADAFAVALARELNARLVSGDPELRRLHGVVEVVWQT